MMTMMLGLTAASTENPSVVKQSHPAKNRVIVFMDFRARTNRKVD